MHSPAMDQDCPCATLFQCIPAEVTAYEMLPMRKPTTPAHVLHVWEASASTVSIFQPLCAKTCRVKRYDGAKAWPVTAADMVQ